MEKTTIDLAATDRWGGIGLERKIYADSAGLFGGVGYDIKSKEVETRAGVTVKF